MPKSRIAQLAQLISSGITAIDAHLGDNGLPMPSFDPDSPVQAVTQDDMVRVKNEVLEATIELRQLLEGPMNLLLPESNFAPLAAVYNFDIASNVPIDATISFADLANKCNILEHDIQRIVRYTAVHHRVFSEPQKGYVAHTAASKLLAESQVARDLMGLTFQECWPAHNRAVEAMAHKSEDAGISGYALANNFANSSMTTFDFLSKNADRAQQFARAMGSTSVGSMDALSNYFDWANVPQGGKVVDIGGSRGHVSIHLAQKYQHLLFVVQDLPNVIEGAAVGNWQDVESRIQFMPHDMFSKQPVKNADVYFLRFVLHDWQNSYCVKILRNIVPSLKKGARIVIQDHLLPDPGSMTLLQEMQVRSMDAIMLSLFNSRERDEDDWRQLFSNASTGFTSITIKQIPESPTTAIITAEWSGN
ncbi:cercosporin toxin biosynthesis protein [Trichophyton equinum CBS 127.97]|uniref:Cercosporin toxin biosynthesis protein n=1 Tax=Trichophyton equinum (strain ATCC MYA-4606 / CBS 127.97) TaxID=559882 RepID=F2PUC1_TRIEC|nr:cercosporin toxin biosynthesis protein [Trichophyton equinum CBS 127.97]